LKTLAALYPILVQKVYHESYVAQVWVDA
jgi:hypothetical protein